MIHYGAAPPAGVSDGGEREKLLPRGAKSCCGRSPRSPWQSSAWRLILGEKLIDRSAKDLLLTDAGKIVLDYARRFENLQGELENSLAELRDKSAGRLTIGANESSTLYLLDHIEKYRRQYPKIKVQIRRSLSSKIPAELIDGELELGILTYDPEDERLVSQVIYHRSPGVHRFAAAPAGGAGGGFDHRTGRGNIHRAQCRFALSRAW